MQNWQKDRNYRKYENADGSFRFVITVDGEDVEVGEELYKEYAASGRKMEYDTRGDFPASYRCKYTSCAFA